jgi:hypothetical protein
MQQPRKCQYARQQQRDGRDGQDHRPGTWLLHPGSSLRAVMGWFMADPPAGFDRAILTFGVTWVDGYGDGLSPFGRLTGSRSSATWTQDLERSP